MTGKNWVFKDPEAIFAVSNARKCSQFAQLCDFVHFFLKSNLEIFKFLIVQRCRVSLWNYLELTFSTLFRCPSTHYDFPQNAWYYYLELTVTVLSYQKCSFKAENTKYFNEELQTADWWYAQEFTNLEFC